MFMRRDKMSWVGSWWMMRCGGSRCMMSYGGRVAGSAWGRVLAWRNRRMSFVCLASTFSTSSTYNRVVNSAACSWVSTIRRDNTC